MNHAPERRTSIQAAGYKDAYRVWLTLFVIYMAFAAIFLVANDPASNSAQTYRQLAFGTMMFIMGLFAAIKFEMFVSDDEESFTHDGVIVGADLTARCIEVRLNDFPRSVAIGSPASITIEPVATKQPSADGPARHTT